MGGEVVILRFFEYYIQQVGVVNEIDIAERQILQCSQPAGSVYLSEKILTGQDFVMCDSMDNVVVPVNQIFNT